MEETKVEKKKCCCCTATMGILVIVLAWCPVSWGAIALTVIGVLLIVKELVGCCCRGKVCKT